MRIRLLGSGTSSGVPRIGGDWGACDPAEPRNRRRRASLLVQAEQTTILVDTSPDMREQLLDARCAELDAVIWTHDHADHTHGIDDLRQLWFARGAPVTGYARPATMAVLRRRFDYVFEGKGGYPATASITRLPDWDDDSAASTSAWSISRMEGSPRPGCASRRTVPRSATRPTSTS